MMPIDPYFTSGFKDEEERKKKLKVQIAKVQQFRIHTHQLTTKKFKKAMKHALATPDQIISTQLQGSVSTISGPGRPSLTGFKQPRKKWTEHRK